MQGQVNARTAAVAYLDSCMPIIIIPINTLADYVINVFVIMWTILTGYQCAKSIIIEHNLLFLFPILILIIIIMEDQVVVYQCKEYT